jgi:hypothetical protein
MECKSNFESIKTHTIHWKSQANGTAGAGTRLLGKEEAERLAAELNRDYPGIYHEAVLALPIASVASKHSAI